MWSKLKDRFVKSMDEVHRNELINALDDAASGGPQSGTLMSPIVRWILLAVFIVGLAIVLWGMSN